MAGFLRCKTCREERPVAEFGLTKKGRLKKQCLGCEAKHKAAWNAAYRSSPEVQLAGRHCAMMQRCYDETRSDFKYYGGRGLSVCPQWHDREEFIRWSLSAGYEGHLVLDRIDVNGDYSPDNCRYVTVAQSIINRRGVRLLEVLGETMSVAAWARDSRVPVTAPTIRRRLDVMGWPPEVAVTTAATRGRYAVRSAGSQSVDTAVAAPTGTAGSAAALGWDGTGSNSVAIDEPSAEPRKQASRGVLGEKP